MTVILAVIYESIKNLIVGQLPEYQLYEGDVDVTKELPGLFLKLIPTEINSGMELTNYKFQVHVACASGSTYLEDLRLVDRVIPLLSSFSFDDRTLTAEKIISKYEDKVLTIIGDYQLTIGHQLSEGDLMEELNLRQ